MSVVPETPGKGLRLPDTAALLDQGGFFRPRWWSRRVPNEVREAWCGWLEELPAARTREALLDAGIPKEELDMDAWRREMARAHTGGWHRITRRNLLTACAVHHDEHRWGRTLVACYAWGTGETGGWRGGRLGRSLSVLAPSDLLERLEAAAETVQHDPVAAYTSMLSGGPSKVGYLGSAFFTKFLYAAAAEGDGPETSGSPRPGRALILDQRVAQALNDLNGWTWPNGNHTQHQYRTWLNYADDIAASGVDDAGRPIRTDAVEYAVFLWGRELKTRPKKNPTAPLAD